MAGGNPIHGIVVKGGQNPKPQNRSTANKEGSAREADAPPRDDDPPPPEASEGAINTTRSNIKNTS